MLWICTVVSRDTVACGDLSRPVICCLTLSHCCWRDLLWYVMSPVHQQHSLLLICLSLHALLKVHTSSAQWLVMIIIIFIVDIVRFHVVYQCLLTLGTSDLGCMSSPLWAAIVDSASPLYSAHKLILVELRWPRHVAVKLMLKTAYYSGFHNKHTIVLSHMWLWISQLQSGIHCSTVMFGVFDVT